MTQPYTRQYISGVLTPSYSHQGNSAQVAMMQADHIKKKARETVHGIDQEQEKRRLAREREEEKKAQDLQRQKEREEDKRQRALEREQERHLKQMEKEREQREKQAEKQAEKARRIYTMELETQSIQMLDELSDQFKADPQRLSETAVKARDKMAEQIEDPLDKMEFMAKFNVKMRPYINKAREQFQQVQNARYETAQMDLFNTAKNGMALSFENALSQTAGVDDIASFTLNMNEALEVVNAKDENGLPVWSESQRGKMTETLDTHLVGSFGRAFERLSKERQQAVLSGLNDETLSVAGDMPLKDQVTPEVYKKFKTSAGSIYKNRIEAEKKQAEQAVLDAEAAFSEQLDPLNTGDALNMLYANKHRFSSTYFKAAEERILSQAGITAQTRADVFQNILLDVVSLDDLAAADYMRHADQLLTQIETLSAGGELAPRDRQSLARMIKKGQGEKITELSQDDDTDTSFWRADYTYKDAYEDLIEEVSDLSLQNDIFLAYFRNVDGKEDLGRQDRKNILRALIDQKTVDAFKDDQKQQSGDTHTIDVGYEFNGYRYIGGDVNSPESWKEI